MFFTIFLFVVLIVLITIFVSIKDVRHDKRIPHMSGRLPFFGNILTLMVQRMIFGSNLDATVKRAKHYNNLYYVTLPKIGTELVINDTESVEWILQTNFKNYNVPPIRKTLGEDVWGDGIFLTNGEEWKYQRKLATPIFKVNSLQQMIPILEKHAQILVDVIKGNKKENKTFDVQELFKRFTLDTIGEIGFGVEINSLKEPVEFSKLFDWILDAQIAYFFYGKIYKDFIVKKQWSETIKKLDEFVFKIIDLRREEPEEELKKRGDLLSIYLTTETKDNKPLSNKFIRDSLFNFFIAGRDTTSLLLTWTIYNLDKYPEVRNKMIEEIKSTIEVIDIDDPVYDITLQKLKDLKYTRKILDETLRLYPVALPYNSKIAVDDDVLPNGAEVKKGGSVSYSSYALHRNPKYWGDDAEEFKPSRWDDPDIMKNSFKFVPFQKGQRICLGQDLAYYEVKIVLTYLVHNNIILKVDPNHKVKPISNIVLPAENGIMVS
eukprot:TRINITY_DN1094_c1_g1_i1.p1 TRINITY_DN1094_c1_g1~~TRINITY_DN1094_c1_g1_i1.p1  ORF type:complete len:490 (-),score=106.21 TRINITY_DN1094_c1_g1_i1:227-1696(-)